MKRFWIVLFLVWGVTRYANGQLRYITSRLDNTSGLSNNTVNEIFQDSDRLLWISTQDGLNVFNGSTFQLFKSYSNESSFSLPDNNILNTREDNHKQIWICTEKGITCYNKNNGTLKHYFYNLTKRNGSNSADYFLSIRPGGTVLAGLRLDSTIYEFNRIKNEFLPLKFDIASLGKIAETVVDEKDRLWTISIGGALRVFSRNSVGYHLLKSFDKLGLYSFYNINHRMLFVSGSGTIFELGDKFDVHKLVDLPHLSTSISFFQGHYFVSFAYKGFQEYDADFKPVNNILKYCPQLNEETITSFLNTSNDILWAATSDHGFYKILANRNNFGTVDRSSASTVINNTITTFAKINNELWVGTRNNGIIKFNYHAPYRNGKIINPANSSFDQTSNNYYAIKKGLDNLAYIGSDAYGITLYDLKAKKIVLWSDIKGTKYDKDFFKSFCILPCSDSSILVGYQHGLIQLKVRRTPSGEYQLDYLKKFSNAKSFLSLGNNAITSLVQIDNYILVGYQFAGIALLNLKNGRFLNIANQTPQNGLRSANVNSLYQDQKKRIWIGTALGLSWITYNDLFNKNPTFHTLTTDNGLSDNNIHGITEDNNHNIWVSTNKGLSKIDPVNFKILQYQVQDGLQNNQFQDGSVWKDELGKLYFGGVSGFNYFDPNAIPIDKNLSNLLISDLSFGERKESGAQLLIVKPFEKFKSKTYDIPRNENFFRLKIEPANGFKNIKFQYQYMLTGYDRAWHESDDYNRIEYSNLPQGDYTFFLRWSNGQGEWTSEKQVFQLHVAPYILLTTVAKTIYLLIAVVILYIIIRIRKSRSEYKNKLLIENLVRVKEQKLYQEKVNFFTNITHELQTPLTLILGSIERFTHYHSEIDKRSRNWKFINIANQETFRLQYLVHQLLEFRKAESGHAKVVMQYFSASSLTNNIVELFGPIIEQKSLTTELNIKQNILIKSDKDKFEKIVFNLYSNAFKHSPIGHTIKCEMALKDNRYLHLSISNSGFKSNNLDLSLLFEQFYTIDHNKNSKTSTGIGLALTKQLTEILGGTIGVKVEGDWIIFDLLLPANNQHSNIIVEDNQLSSDKPSYLLRSIVESMHISSESVSKNNERALIENLETPGKKSILIVEDDHNIRLLLKEVLQERFVIYESDSGTNAIILLKKIIPTLILSDILMKDMDGLALCAHVKNNVRTCHIPFLLLSALNSPEEKLEGFEAGADGYLTKPYSVSRLIKKINELIDYREKFQQFLSTDQQTLTGNYMGLKIEDQDFLNHVIRYINEEISNIELDASYLEKELNMSRMSFYRRLMSLTNMTPGEFIKHLRLKQASILLKTTNLTVSEIYFKSGFNNQSYFYREFKKIYNCAPKEYRDQE